MRRPSLLELALLVVNAVFLVIGLSEVVTAAMATACGGEGTRPGCYPWGTEGPVAGYWIYQSKANYLIDLGGKIGVLLLAMSLPFYSTRRIANTTALALVVPAILLFSWFMFHTSQLS